MEIICVPAIVAIVYGLIEIYKALTKNKDEKYLKIIPLVAGALGAILGVGFYFILPAIVIADSWWVALIVGACSGLSAVGSNQIFKQIKKLGIEVKEAEQKDVDEAVEQIKSEIISFGAWSDEMEEAFKKLQSKKTTAKEKGSETNANV